MRLKEGMCVREWVLYMAEVGDRVIKDKVCRGKGLHLKKYIPDNHHHAKDHTAAPVCDKDRFT